ncbi:MAG: outer membrane protein assembly factor BamB family protein [Thermoleophilia bacterium]
MRENSRRRDTYARLDCSGLLVALFLIAIGAAPLLVAACGKHQGRPPATAAARSPKPQASGSRLPGPFPGLLLIADRGNDRLLVVDGRKRVVWVYPRPGAKPSFPLRYDDDAFFCPGYRAIISSQEMQHTIQIISFPEGKVPWHYGHVDRPGSAPGYLDRPDDAYVRADGTRTVADIVNQRVLFISPAGKVVRQYGTTGVSGHRPPHVLGAPNGDAPTPGGGMLITEIAGSWVDAVSAAGRLLWSLHTPAAYPSDAQLLPGGRILLADYSGPGRVFIIDRRGRVLWRYGPSSGPGQLDHPSLAALLPGGLIAVSDDFHDRVVLIDPRTRKVVWQYGHTGHAGSASGYLNTPDGLDFLPARAIADDPAIAALLRAPTSP